MLSGRTSAFLFRRFGRIRQIPNGGGHHNSLSASNPSSARYHQQHQQHQQHQGTVLNALKSTSNEARYRSPYAYSQPTFRRHVAVPSTRLFSDMSPYASDSSSVAAPQVIRDEEHSTYTRILDGLNPAQVEAVTQPTSAVTRVIAGPGSGKTRVLICRTAFLLEEDKRSRILAVTFTRKAAGEMQQRLEKLLVLAHEGPEGVAERQRQEQMQRQRALENDDINFEGDDVQQKPKGLERVTLGTFHSVCAKILRFNGHLLPTLPTVSSLMVGFPGGGTALDGGFAIADQAEQLRVLKQCLVEHKIELKDTTVKPIEILNAIGEIKDCLATGKGHPAERLDAKGKRAQIPPKLKYATTIYDSFRQNLFSGNGMDFDDLIFLTREMLLKHQDVRQGLHRRWSHVLVDEFQDTSAVQLDLVKLLTSSSLFVVGDADQSIYSWRGAYVGSLDEFSETFNHFLGEVSTVYLMENYRSTANIVKAAQKIISVSGGKNGGDNSKNHSSSNKGLRQAMKPQRGKGPNPRVVACDDGKAEAAFVVDTILGRIADGSMQTDQTVAIIYRTNAQSRHLEEVCVQKNLPYVIRGAAGGFYKRAEVKDCLCFLRWLSNGRDRGSMIRAMKTPSKGIGDKAIVEFAEYCNEVDRFYSELHPNEQRPSPFDVLISLTDEETKSASLLLAGSPEASVVIAKRALTPLTKFSRTMRSVQEKAHELPVSRLIDFIVEALELEKHFDSISKSKSECEERIENVRELIRAAERYNDDGPALLSKALEADANASVDSDGDSDEPDLEMGADTSLTTFLDDVALVTDIASENADNDKSDQRIVASLMTIHASKGMEFDSVFFVGLEDGTLPSHQSINEGPGSVSYEEERRLVYVAMTRAKTDLVMSWRKEKMVFGNGKFDKASYQKTKRSRFLDALMPKGAQQKSSQMRKGAGRISQAEQHRSSGTRNMSTERRFNDRPQYRTEAPSQRTSRSASPARRQQTLPVSSSSNSGSNYAHRNAARTAASPRQQQIPAGRNGASPANTQQFQTRRPSTPSFRDNSMPQTPKLSRPTPKPRARKEQGHVDSTWIFPVGSRVLHKKRGHGTVLNPPPATDRKDLKVRVRFPNNEVLDFPAATDDITIELG